MPSLMRNIGHDGCVHSRCPPLSPLLFQSTLLSPFSHCRQRISWWWSWHRSKRTSVGSAVAWLACRVPSCLAPSGRPVAATVARERTPYLSKHGRVRQVASSDTGRWLSGEADSVVLCTPYCTHNTISSGRKRTPSVYA